MKENKNFKVAFAELLGLLIFSTIVSAQEATVPIVWANYLIGGAKNGRWLAADAVVPTLVEKSKFRTVDLEGVGKNSVVLENFKEEFGACPENRVIRMSPEIEGGIAVGDNAKWNLVPRPSQSIAVTDKTYLNIAANFLKTRGIARTKIKLDQILRVDLEGDGREEIIITGNFYKKAMIETQSAGDYSFALLRKIVKGKPQNILIEGEFFPKRDPEASPPNTREILAVADLNGDGKMEIVLHTAYYEGNWEAIYEIGDNKLLKRLEVSCIV